LSCSFGYVLNVLEDVRGAQSSQPDQGQVHPAGVLRLV
jgi:hypothetical protein